MRRRAMFIEQELIAGRLLQGIRVQHVDGVDTPGPVVEVPDPAGDEGQLGDVFGGEGGAVGGGGGGVFVDGEGEGQAGDSDVESSL